MILMNSAHCPFPLLQCTLRNPRPIHCALVFSSIVYCSGFFVFCFLQGDQSVRGGCADFGWGIPCDTWCSFAWSAKSLPSMFGFHSWLWQQCRGGSLPVLKVYHGVEKTSMGYGSGCQCLNPARSFTFTKHGSSISARSLIHRAQAVCACSPVTILDPLLLLTVLQLKYLHPLTCFFIL
jgi:hypothetical protein